MTEILKESKGIDSRRLALESLIRIDKQGEFATTALASAFRRKTLSHRDRAFVTALVLGVTRQRSMLDSIIEKHAARPLNKMPAPVINNLRMAIFQIEYMNDIPPSAVLFTSGELAKLVGHKGQVSFVNAILRSILRDRDASGVISHPKSMESPEDAESLANQYSMPVWLVERWLNNFGSKEVVMLLEQAQKPGKLVLRATRSAITVEELIASLESRGLNPVRGKLVPDCLIIEQGAGKKRAHGPPQELPGYSQGLFSIQDEASAFVSKVVDPKPGQFVVDLCAAPGSKSIHMAELMENSGQLIAVDQSQDRLDTIKENRTRLRLTNIQLRQADSREFELTKQADYVLLDAPCTGTGVLNKRPDLRHHKSLGDIGKLVTLQRQLLENAAQLVCPGGVLVYSTCSIEPEENRENMEWFLETHKDFKGSSLITFIPESTLKEWTNYEVAEFCKEITKTDASNGFIQLLPWRHGVSGFFIARMVKNPE